MKPPSIAVRFRAALAAVARLVKDPSTLLHVLIVVHSLLGSGGPTTPIPTTAPIEVEAPAWTDVA